MLDVLRMLFCGAGAVYLVVRVGGHIRSLVRGCLSAIAASAPDDGFNRSGLHPRMHTRDAAPRVEGRVTADR